jgi:Fe-S cluster assembly protein SufD
MNAPLRLSPAEQTLIAQLHSVNAVAEAERLAGAGLPTRRVESYHYTDLKLLLRAVPDLAGASVSATASPLAVPGARRLTIANGRPQPVTDLPAGIRADTVHGSVLSQRDDVVVRLNAALVGEALSLEISGAVAEILQIDRRIEGAAGHAASAAKVFVGDNASVTIVETYSGSDAAHVGNHATYMALGRNAVVTHVTVDLSPRPSTHFATNEYVLAEGARLRTLVIHAGAGLARTQLFPKFAGKGAHADVTGLNLVGDGQHADITMDASHAVPGTSSKPLFKSIARGRAKAVVQGRLIVARDAQKTDAKFMHQGLMLSEEAEILSKPELEIYADDVVCGHGSTCGQLDEDHLFYLMSRGISKGDAEVMLIRAFLAELVDPIEDEGLQAVLTGVIDDWLSSK